MGRETVLFRSKAPSTRAETVEFLRSMADRIEGGQVVLRRGEEETALTLSDQLELRLKAEDEHKRGKGVQHTLKIELKWYQDASASAPVELG